MPPIQELSPKDVKVHKDDYIIVDVREPEELPSDGAIERAILATMGPKLTQFLNSADPQKAYVFLCRRGRRSAQACEIAQMCGFQNVYNLKGGILAWNEMKNKG